MKNFIQANFSLFALSILILTYCDAPRNNPLDPENPGNNLVGIEGTIQTTSVPRSPIANVNVIWENNNIVIQSDQAGHFNIKNIERKDGWIYFNKVGYSQDSTLIQWESTNKISLNIFLNSIPKLDSVRFYSVVQNRYPSNQTYQLVFEAVITDDENDVDTVFIENEELQVSQELNKISSTYFERMFSINQLNLNSVDDVIGQNFEIVVLDRESKIFNIGSSSVKRIIKEEIKFISPSNREPVSPTPTLRWQRFTPGFSFQYHVQIYTDEIDPILVWEKENVHSDSISIIVDEPLPTAPINEYFWVIWGIDEFKD